MSRDTGSGPGDSVKEAIPEIGRKKDGYIVTRAGGRPTGDVRPQSGLCAWPD